MGQTLTWTITYSRTNWHPCWRRRGPRATVRCEREIGHPDFHAGRTRRGGWILWPDGHEWGTR